MRVCLPNCAQRPRCPLRPSPLGPGRVHSPAGRCATASWRTPRPNLIHVVHLARAVLWRGRAAPIERDYAMIIRTLRFTTSAFALCLSGLPAVSFAQATCDDDADCEQGFECRTVGSSGCAVPDCPPGEECADAPPCEATELRVCVPGSCENTADCADGMRCHEYEYRSCQDVPTCSPGQDCDTVEAGINCQVEMRSQCLPSWALPCEVAADCGDAFLCVEGETCQCSGGGGGGSPTAVDAGAATPPDVALQQTSDEPVCDCTPSGTFYCRSEVTECSADEECPTDWTCRASGTSCGSGGSPLDGGRPEEEPAPANLEQTSSAAGDGSVLQATDDCEPNNAERVCAPPDYYRYVDVTGYGNGTGTPAEEPVEDDGNSGGEEPSESGDAGGESSDDSDVGGESSDDSDVEFDSDTTVNPVSENSPISCVCATVSGRWPSRAGGILSFAFLAISSLGLARRFGGRA
jgi:hypothetical protein